MTGAYVIVWTDSRRLLKKHWLVLCPLSSQSPAPTGLALCVSDATPSTWSIPHHIWKQKRSNAQIQAIVQMVLPKQRPASYVSIVASKNGHDSETLDFWAQSKPIYNHQDTSLDVYHPQIKHDESAIDSIWCRWRLNSTRQPNPVFVMDGHFPSLAEPAEAFRRSRRNSKTSLPSSSSTNHAATTTTARRPKSRDVMVHSWTGK